MILRRKVSNWLMRNCRRSASLAISLLCKDHPPTGRIEFGKVKNMIWHQNCCINKTFLPSAEAGGRIVTADAFIYIKERIAVD
jgi:hypothetical protein